MEEGRSEEEIQISIEIARSEIAVNEAQARLNRAEAVESEAKGEIARMAVENESLSLNRNRVSYSLFMLSAAKDEASNDRHRVYNFNGEVSETSVKSCLNQLNEWIRMAEATDDKAQIEIIFNSPGGAIIDGLALYDHIQIAKRRGHHFTTTALGMAASMGGILLQAGDKRTMGAESVLLIHEASFGASGSMGQVEDTVELIKKLQERLLNILCSRSTMTVDEMKHKWERKNWWLTSPEALELGLVDEIR